MPVPPMAIVEVVWIDSNMANGWHSIEEMMRTVTQGAMACRTAGYLFLDQADRVAIVSSQADNDNVGDAITIPRVAIKSMTVIRAVTGPSTPLNGLTVDSATVLGGGTMPW